jgi:hypothetical protein
MPKDWIAWADAQDPELELTEIASIDLVDERHPAA